MKTMYQMVSDFHEAFGHPSPLVPSLIDPDRLAVRRKWADEERVEFDEAFAAGDLVACADALADELYFLLGTCREMGMPIDAIFAAVHKANMDKLQHQEPHKQWCDMLLVEGALCSCGKILYNEVGKTMKPEGWSGPEPVIRKLIGC